MAFFVVEKCRFFGFLAEVSNSLTAVFFIKKIKNGAKTTPMRPIFSLALFLRPFLANISRVVGYVESNLAINAT